MVRLPPSRRSAMLGAFALFLVVFASAPATTVNAEMNLRVDDEFRGDFDEEMIADMFGPTDLQISPDEQLMMVTAKEGILYIIQDYDTSKPQTTKALQIKDMCLESERGLSGCAFHPEFGKDGNRYIYLYYTHDKFGDCDATGDPKNGPVNRLSRFVLDENLQVDRDSEEIFFDTPIMPYGAHNSGNIAFGNDGLLYVSVGDGGGGISTRNEDDVLYPQALDMLLGKILRLTPDGDIPSSNPFVRDKSERCQKTGWASKANIKCQEIFSYGLRNPFRFAMNVNERELTQFYINDVGRKTWESIREAGDGFAGANYGYPEREGPCKKKMSTKCAPPDDRSVVDPIHWYIHDEENGGAITGGAFYPNNAAGWHPSFQDSYLYADYAWGGIYRMKKDGEGCAYPKCDPPVSPYADSVKVFSSLMKVTAIRFGPYKGGQALYGTTRGDIGNKGEHGIFRVSYKGPLYETGKSDADVNDYKFPEGIEVDVFDHADWELEDEIIVERTPAPTAPPTKLPNRSPRAFLSSDITLGFVPFEVNFDASESFDPEDDQIHYVWDFGDGETQVTKGPLTRHTYTKPGDFSPSVTVYDWKGEKGEASIDIVAEKPPYQPMIIEPRHNDRFAVGDSITLVGDALDHEGRSSLPKFAFSWEIRMHHNDTHYHQLYGPIEGNDIEISDVPGPAGVTDALGSYLIILLTVTDPTGVQSTARSIMQPNLIDILFITEPSGLYLQIDEQDYTTPVMLTTWEKQRFSVYAPAQRNNNLQTGEAGAYVWDSWSDGEKQSHEFVAQKSNTRTGSLALVAKFQGLQFSDPSISGTTLLSAEDGTTTTDDVVSLQFDTNIAAAAVIGLIAAASMSLMGFVVLKLNSRRERIKEVPPPPPPSFHLPPIE